MTVIESLPSEDNKAMAPAGALAGVIVPLLSGFKVRHHTLEGQGAMV